jgi:methanogenic corrinoid protein MtbC1
VTESFAKEIGADAYAADAAEASEKARSLLAT